MKFLMFALVLLSCGDVVAESLDSLMAKQNVAEIQPVTINNEHVSDRSAAYLCAALGFTRVVDLKAEDCTDNEKLVYFSQPSEESGAAIVQGEVFCSVYYHPRRLMSLTCAK